jgi:hypothetical protein
MEFRPSATSQLVSSNSKRKPVLNKQGDETNLTKTDERFARQRDHLGAQGLQHES